MKTYFEKLAAFLEGLLQPQEAYTCHLLGEDSDFVRFSRGRIRQAGNVRQWELRLDLIAGRRHAAGNVNLSENADQDHRTLSTLVDTLRAQSKGLPEDPHLLFATEINDSEDMDRVLLPDSQSVVEEILDSATGMDLVGIWASGPLFAGFANSFGQRNWYQTGSYSLDWSCFKGRDSAVKASHAGQSWKPEELTRKMAQVRSQLRLMERPTVTIKPGRYRAYLAPAALNELLGMVAWGGFGLKSQRTAQSPLIKMTTGGTCLHPSVTLMENRGEGLMPRFTEDGFMAQACVELISRGQYRNSLVSPRSSMEYGLPVNAGAEIPQSLDMLPGDLHRKDILEQLDTGVYLSNLWYGNFSDRNDCRITAMTRFACFRVEQGEIVAPMNVMRLDDSIYRVLGDRLAGLTREREFIADPGTYARRSLASVRLPGALVEDFTFTL